MKDWGALHDRKSRWYRPENPELPTLSPWRPRTTPPAELFVFERNPYYHRVDENGRQLPYIDAMTMSIGSSSLVPAKVGAGAADLAARYIRFEDYTFLKAGEERNNYSVRLWERGEGSYASLVPNLNVSDPVWRSLFRDVRVRRALSVGFDRHTVNQVIFFGLAHEGANTVLPASPLYDPKLDQAWAQLRSRPRQQASRRSRSEPLGRRRHPASARWTPRRNNHRDRWRQHRGIRHPRTRRL